jgi:hypothetical protein
MDNERMERLKQAIGRLDEVVKTAQKRKSKLKKMLLEETAEFWIGFFSSDPSVGGFDKIVPVSREGSSFFHDWAFSFPKGATLPIMERHDDAKQEWVKMHPLEAECTGAVISKTACARYDFFISTNRQKVEEWVFEKKVQHAEAVEIPPVDRKLEG